MEELTKFKADADALPEDDADALPEGDADALPEGDDDALPEGDGDELPGANAVPEREVELEECPVSVFEEDAVEDVVGEVDCVTLEVALEV